MFFNFVKISLVMSIVEDRLHQWANFYKFENVPKVLFIHLGRNLFEISLHLIINTLNDTIAAKITVPPPHVSKNSNNCIDPNLKNSNGMAYPMVKMIPVSNHATATRMSFASLNKSGSPPNPKRMGKMRDMQNRRIDKIGHQLPISAHGIIIMRMPHAKTIEMIVMNKMFLLFDISF